MRSGKHKRYVEGLKGAVMRFMLATCGVKEMRMDAFLDMPQAGVACGRAQRSEGSGNCEILRAFYYNYCYAYAMWYGSSPLRVINRLTITNQASKTKAKGKKEGKRRAGGKRDLLEGKL